MSEVIGNLLILAITVTLFSSVLFFVTNMPAPAQATFTDLSPDIKSPFEDPPGSGSWHIWVNVTHKGGQTLMNWTTGIYLFLDGAFMGELSISNGTNDLGDKWETGEVWAYRLGLLSSSITSLSIMIVDKNTNSIVWQSDLIGGESEFSLPPIITERWTEPAVANVNESLDVHVRVIDPNDDLITSVTLDLTSLGLSSHSAFPLTRNLAGNNEWYGTLPADASISWNRKQIVINATDDTGLSGTALMTIYVFTGGGGGGEGNETEAFDNFNLSGLQGFAIFEEADWDAYKLNSVQQTEFTRGLENAVVVLISKLVVNMEKENTFLVLNPTNKQVVQEVSSITGNDFVFYRNVAGYYIYNVTIPTIKLPDVSRYYTITAVITDNYQPSSHTLKISTEIFVKTDPSAAPSNPKMITYQDSAFTQPTDDFSTYDPINNKIYVEIQTSLSNPYILNSGNVEIRDFYWNAQISRTAPPPAAINEISPDNWNGPLSNIWQIDPAPAGKEPGTYRFVINLQNATEGYPWIPGNNAYILRFDVFSTTGETHLLNEVIYIDSPTTKLDLVVGSLPSTSSNSAWSGLISLLYYANDNSWNPPNVLISTPSKVQFNPEVMAVQAGDLNGDGRGDAVAVVYDDVNGSPTKGTYVYAFISQPNGGWLQTTVAARLFTGAPPSDFHLTIGNIDQDDDLDIVITYDGDLRLYRNAGYWAAALIDSGITGIVDVKLGDMDPPETEGNDPERSLDIVLAAGAELRIYRNVDRFGNFNVANMIKLAGTSAQMFDYAISEQSIEGTVSSNPVTAYPYYNTQGAADAWIYEKITEEMTLLTKSLYPTDKNIVDSPPNDVNDPISQLSDSDDLPYTVGYDDVASVIFGDQTDISDAFNTLNVEFIVNYTTDGYTANRPIEWYDPVSMAWIPMMTLEDTLGEYREVIWNLTAYFATAENLTDLKVRYINAGVADYDTVDFYSWKVNVTWVVGDSLSHEWTFQVTPGTGQLFSVFAAVGETSTDGDTFQFQYSEDGLTWANMTGVVISSTTFGFKTYSLPASVSDIVYVRVVDTDSALNNNPELNSVKVSQMYFRTNAVTTKIGDVIRTFDLADINGDNSTDIVVGSYTSSVGKKGQVWTLNNSLIYVDVGGELVKTSGIFRDENIFKWYESPTNGPLTTTNKWTIVAGSFFNPYEDEYLDIIFSEQSWDKKDTSNVYAINIMSSSYTLVDMDFLEPASAPITVMLAKDVDGNHRTDLIFGTLDGMIIMWANYEGYTTNFGWQIYLIDDLSDGINAMDAATFTI